MSKEEKSNALNKYIDMIYVEVLNKVKNEDSAERITKELIHYTRKIVINQKRMPSINEVLERIHESY